MWRGGDVETSTEDRSLMRTDADEKTRSRHTILHLIKVPDFIFMCVLCGKYPNETADRDFMQTCIGVIMRLGKAGFQRQAVCQVP